MDAYALVNLLHVLAALAVIGGLAIPPLLDAPAGRLRQAQYAAHLLDGLRRGTWWLIVPGFVGLVVTGVVMVVGPLAEWDVLLPEGRWILAGAIVWMPLGAAVGFVLGILRQRVVRLGRGDVDAAERLRWRHVAGCGAGLALALLAEALMVIRPTF